MSRERKVDVSKLKPGLYISRLDRPWSESPFLFQGFTLQDWEEVEEVRTACEFVYVEEGREHDAAGSGAGDRKARNSGLTGKSRKRSDSRPVSPVHAREETHPESWEERLARQLGKVHEQPPPILSSLQKELESARPLIRHTHELVQQQVRDARNGRSLDIPAARECVEGITESILRNPDALVCLSGLKKRDEYTYLHSLSVCILSISLGRRIGLPRETLLELGFGAFLHDIGKMNIPDNVLNKPGGLTPEEMAIMRKHPEFGVEIVEGSERIPTSSRNVIYSHHERLDGSGYTEGAAGRQIHPLTHIVSVCDTYDAIISHRPYKKASSPLDATWVLYKGRGRFFEPDLVHQFIECIGVYPVGSLVELSTGAVGVVIAASNQSLRPEVLVILDEDGQRLGIPYAINLADTRQNTAGQSVHIKKSLRAGAHDLDPDEWLGYLEREG